MKMFTHALAMLFCPHNLGLTIQSALSAFYYLLVHCAINTRLVRSPSRTSVPLVHVRAEPVENLGRCVLRTNSPTVSFLSRQSSTKYARML